GLDVADRADDGIEIAHHAGARGAAGQRGRIDGDVHAELEVAAAADVGGGVEDLRLALVDVRAVHDDRAEAADGSVVRHRRSGAAAVHAATAAAAAGEQKDGGEHRHESTVGGTQVLLHLFFSGFVISACMGE